MEPTQLFADANVYLFPYNDDGLRKRHIFRLLRPHVKGTETHKIAKLVWKNLGANSDVTNEIHLRIYAANKY